MRSRRIGLIAALVLAAGLAATGCTDSGELGKRGGSSDDTASSDQDPGTGEGGLTYEYVDLCDTFDAQTYYDLVHDDRSPKPDVDTGNPDTGSAICSWTPNTLPLQAEYVVDDEKDLEFLNFKYDQWVDEGDPTTAKYKKRDIGGSWDKAISKVTTDDPENAVRSGAFIIVRHDNIGIKLRCATNSDITPDKLLKTLSNSAEKLANAAKK